MGYLGKANESLRLSEGSAWWVVTRETDGAVGVLENVTLSGCEFLPPNSNVILSGGAAGVEGSAVPSDRTSTPPTASAPLSVTCTGALPIHFDIGTVYAASALHPTLFLEQSGAPGEQLTVTSRTREGLTGVTTLRRGASR